MKKLLAMLAISGSMVACNNSADSADATADSLRRDSITQDSIRNANANQMNTPAPGVGDSSGTTIPGSTGTGKDSGSRRSGDSLPQ